MISSSATPRSASHTDGVALWLNRVVLTPVIIVLAVAFLLAVLVTLCDANPASALRYFWEGSMGTPVAWGETLSRWAILSLSGLAVVVSFRAGLFNIGAEGQFLLGAAMAAAVGLKVLPAGVPAPIGIPLLVLAGALAGCCWSTLAGILKQWRGVSEVIVSLMLNLVGMLIVRLLVSSPSLLRAPGSNFPKSAPLPDGAHFDWWGGTAFHSGVFLVVPLVVGLHVLLFHTRTGLSIRAAGLNPVAARACGIPVGVVTLGVFALSGAFAGVGGALAVMSAGHLPEELYTEYGYMAIGVALVARLHPLAVIPSALFFAVLETGSRAMERHVGVPAQVVFLIEGLIILSLFLHRFRLPGTETRASAAQEARA